MEQIARSRRTFDLPETRNHAAADFAAYGRHLLLGRGDAMLAAQMAEKSGAPSRVVNILKAAVVAGSTLDSDWAGNLLDHRVAANGFLASIATYGLFDRLLSESMVRVPLNSRVVISTIALVGHTVAEGAIKPVNALSFGSDDLQPVKVSCMVVISDDLLRLSAAGAEGFLSAELRKGVVAATDDAFLAGITSGVTPIASGGGTGADDVAADLGALVNEIAITGTSRLYLAISPRLAATVATLPGTGGFAFDMQNGLGGITVVPTDSVPDTEAILIDGSRIVGNSDAIMLASSNEANIVLDDAPAPGTAQTVSMWQNNLHALRCERLLSFRAAAASVAILNSVAWGT